MPDKPCLTVKNDGSSDLKYGILKQCDAGAACAKISLGKNNVLYHVCIKYYFCYDKMLKISHAIINGLTLFSRIVI